MVDKKSSKKIGLALGGGGARGLAHIGVIKILEQAEIPIDFIAGTSMGALVGGWYAATKDIKSLENLFLSIKRKDVASFPEMILRKLDYPFKNKAIIDFLNAGLKEKKIEDCQIPFRAIATDAETGEEVVLKEGSLIEAIKASTALPVILKPVKINKKTLADGGLVNLVPADIVKENGMDVVIAVDVSKGWVYSSENRISIKKAASIISNVIDSLQYQITKKILEKADIILKPMVSNYDVFDFEHAKDIIFQGEIETKNHLKEIQQKTGIYKEIPKTILEKMIDFLFTK